jgi:adenosine deaminase
MLTRELLARLPKAELHTHLDSALRPATMIELARAAKFTLPTTDPDALRRFMLVDDAGNLEDYLARFEYTIPLLQTPEGIERVSYEMVEDAASDGLRYLEVRYCPRLSTRGGLTMDVALEAELRGLSRGERDFGVVTRVINCALRHYAPEVSVAIARLSVAYRDRGVVAFDLAGGEAGRPPGVHQAAFDIAADGCLGITIHAGEAAGADSIAEAVHRCHADRIGHGTRLREDPALRDYLRDRRLPLEINITSNVQTRAVARAADHPVREYLDAGLVVTLCTDGWLMTGVSLTDEYWLAHRELGFTRAEIDRCILDGFASAFLPWPERQALLARVRDELAALP